MECRATRRQHVWGNGGRDNRDNGSSGKRKSHGGSELVAYGGQRDSSRQRDSSSGRDSAGQRDHNGDRDFKSRRGNGAFRGKKKSASQLLDGPCIIHSIDTYTSNHMTNNCYNWKEIEKLKLGAVVAAAATDKPKDGDGCQLSCTSPHQGPWCLSPGVIHK